MSGIGSPMCNPVARIPHPALEKGDKGHQGVGGERKSTALLNCVLLYICLKSQKHRDFCMEVSPALKWVRTTENQTFF